MVAYEQRIGFPAHGPHAQHRFMHPKPIGRGHKDHRPRIPSFTAVDRHDPAHVEHIIVGMGGDDEIIEMPRGILPMIERLGQDPLRIERQSGQGHAVFPGVEGDAHRVFFQRPYEIVFLRHIRSCQDRTGLIQLLELDLLRNVGPLDAQPTGIRHGFDTEEKPFERHPILRNHHLAADELILQIVMPALFKDDGVG